MAPGTVEAMFAKQDKYFSKSEGMFYFQVDSNGTQCLLYWRVDSKQKITHLPNLVALGIVQEEGTAAAIAEVGTHYINIACCNNGQHTSRAGVCFEILSTQQK